MKVLIHDLGEGFDKMLAEKCDKMISANGKYAPCQGCFGCWTKTPAECYMKDKLKDSCRVIGTADELVIITENCYGSYSPAVKNVLDRSIGVSTPFSTYRGGQMHHTLRYGRHRLLTVIAYGSLTEEEAATMDQLAQRNAINMGYNEAKFLRCESAEKAGEML